MRAIKGLGKLGLNLIYDGKRLERNDCALDRIT